VDVSGSLQPAGPGLHPKAAEACGGTDALHPGPGCPAPGGGGQQTIRLPQMGRSLLLLWRWRSGGCLGPEAAAALNARQRQARGDRPAAEPLLDRGARGGLAPGSGLPGLYQILLDFDLSNGIASTVA
jgi:hypothetical protein